MTQRNAGSSSTRPVRIQDHRTGHFSAYALSAGYVQTFEQDADNWLALKRDRVGSVYVISGKVDGVHYSQDFRCIKDARRGMDEAKEYFAPPTENPRPRRIRRCAPAAAVVTGVVRSATPSPDRGVRHG